MQHTTDGNEVSWGFPRRTKYGNKWVSLKGNCTLGAFLVMRNVQYLLTYLLPKLETLSDADIWDSLDIFHEWITMDFRDKLSHGNPMVSGGGQVDRDRTGKMSSRKISGKWASAGTRLKRLQRTGGAGGTVLPNASLTRDEPGMRNQYHVFSVASRCKWQFLLNCWNWFM